MAEIHGMNQKNVENLQTLLEDEKKLNPALNWNIFNERDEPILTSPEKQAISIQVKALEDKIDKVQNKIDLIFDDHILINGRFFKPKS